jgi:hypothetical protein
VKNAGTEEAGTVIRVTPPPNRVAAEKFPADPEWGGHVFEGWYAAGGEFTANTPVTSDMTVYARWTGGGYAPLDACDLLLYYFEDPACVGVPDAGDPLKITITYPSGTSVPADENKIKVLHNGKELRKGDWSSGVREYTVIAESGKEKTYAVTATMGAEPPVLPGEACELLLYYFKKPGTNPPALLRNGKLILEGKSGDELNPFFIDISYPYGTAIPVDGDIIYLFEGKNISWGDWLPQGGGYVRDYTVTAENNAEKHYRIRAVMDGDGGIESYGIDSRAKWLAALAGVTAATDGADADNTRVFEFNITGDFSVEGTTAASFGGNHKTIRLVGIKTISLDPAGPKGSLIRTAANQRFVIDGPTLQGRTDNDAAIVYIAPNSDMELCGGEVKGNGGTTGGGVYIYGNGATFTMSGGTISGNKSTSMIANAANGGGVLVYAGAFTMKGGAISGNEAKGDGGGVGVSGSTAVFTMEGGTISANKASYKYGGGVYVYNGAFTMNGGTVNGNTLGGVALGHDDFSSKGIFTMNGGTISGNTGGGVSVDGYTGTSYGIFTMEGGTISGNTGGGVWAGYYGKFAMSGGTISGNTTYYGGGVLVFGNNATFSKTGGTIYGDSPAGTTTAQTSGPNANTATSTSNIGKNGHAVFLQKSSPTAYYYRNEDLTGADNISSADTLPTTSGQIVGKWTKR